MGLGGGLSSLTGVWFSVAGDGVSYSDELFKFSTVTSTWTLVRCNDGYEDANYTCPNARYGHRMVSIGQDIYMFGGVSTSECSENESAVKKV